MDILKILEERFYEFNHRHPNVKWENVKSALTEKQIKTLIKMEETGGEPDVILYNNLLHYVDCSKESPSGRRSCCFDKEARINRKKNAPQCSAVEMAEEIGIKLLDKDFINGLQEIESFDLKTSSWIDTPPEIRDLGGALFSDRRYDTVFIYHNGADSYYSARGFRGYFTIET